MRFLSEAHPAIYALGRWPQLVDHAQGCEELPEFQAVVQCFNPPSR
jgi:glutathione S-transferase